MNKKLIAVAVAGALVAPAAMADVEVYGKARLSLGINSDDRDTAGTTLDDSKIAIQSHNSRIGIMGSEDLGGGLSAIYKWEQAVSFDTGAWATTGRDTYAGFKGDWGTVKVGRANTPYKNSTGSLDPWGDTSGDYNAIMGSVDGSITTALGSTNTSDLRANNSISYMTNDLNGLSFAIAFSPDQSDDVLPDSSTTEHQLISLMGQYKQGPIFVTAAYESLGELGGTATGAAKPEDIESAKIGGSYAFNNKMTTVGAIWESIDAGKNGATEQDRDAYFLMATHNFGSSTFKASYAVADEYGSSNNTGASFFTLGVSHSLSKSTEIYALAAQVSNDNTTGGGASWKINGGADVSSVQGKDAMAFAFGINHNFSSK